MNTIIHGYIASLPDDEKVSIDELEQCMVDTMQGCSIASLPEDKVAVGIFPLPGVIDTLLMLAKMKDKVACRLVTGNVEGIARRKMRALGIL